MVEENMIPEGWGKDIIGNIVHIGTGSKNTEDAVDDGLYPFYIRSQKIHHINNYAYDEEAVLTAGDGQIGKIFHYVNGKFNAHQRVYVLDHFADNLDPKFFYYYFSACFYDEVMKQSAKTTVDSVRRNMIYDMPIFLPPLAEQRRIAAVLSNLDDYIEKQEKLIEKNKRFRDGMLYTLIPNIDKYTDKQSIEANIPTGWKVQQIRDLGNIVNGATPESTNKLFWDGDIAWISPADMDMDGTISSGTKSITEAGYNSCSTHLLPEGSIVISTRAPIGKVNLTSAPLCTNQGCKSLVLFDNEYNIFVYYSLLTRREEMKKQGTGTTFKELGTDNLKDIFVLCPPRAEQQRIASIMSNLDDNIAKQQAKLDKARKLKDALLNDLISGKIRLTDDER